MGKAVLASQTTSDLFAGNADNLDRMADLARGLGKRLDHGVGIGALARATTQYNDIHRIPSPSCCRRAACFLVTKTNGVNQSPRFSYSHSLEESLLEAWH